MPLETGGLAGPLTHGAGSYVPVEGRVVNLDIRPSDLGSYTLTFAHESPFDGTGDELEWHIYENRAPKTHVIPGEPYDGDTLGEGLHEVLVIPIRQTDTEIPRIVGNVFGNRAFISWGRVDVPDLAAYRVLWNEGTGAADTLLATITLPEAGQVSAEPPTSGTGTGRLSVLGVYSGPRRNGEWLVEVNASSQVTVDKGDGAGDPIEIVEGASVGIGDGLSIFFHDDPDDYVDGDSFAFFVGIQSEWTSDSLEEGSYAFAVQAVDEAGNQSASSSSVTVVIPHVLPPPEGVAVSWEDGAGLGKVTVSWDAATDAAVDGVAIFSNWDAMFGTLREHVIEDWPLDIVSTATGTEFELSIPADNPGEFLFYVRNVDDEGRWEDNAVLRRIQIDAEDGGGIPDIPAPVIVAARAGAGGSVILTVDVDTRIDGQVEDYQVYSGASEDWDVLAVDVQEEFTYDANGVIRAEFTVAGPFAETLRWFGVRMTVTMDAAPSVQVEGPRSNLVSVTPDNTAPAAPTITEGFPT